MDTPKDKKNWWLHLLFLAVGAGILLFLWNAPPESTKKLPHDSDHERFFTMEKKAAEKFCEECHHPQGGAPLPADHPPKYRCLFCHKRT
jgi:hypothetical protein